MTLDEFRRRTADMPGDTNIVKPGADHDYHDVRITKGSALFEEKGRIWTEDHGEEVTSESDYGKRTNVIIVE